MAYLTTDEVRELEGLHDTDDYTEPKIVAAIAYAEEVIDDHTGTSWEYKPFIARMRLGRLRDGAGLTIVYPRTLTGYTIDNNAQVTTGLEEWDFDDDGTICAPAGVIPSTAKKVIVEGTAGFTAVIPPKMKRAAELIARDYLITSISNVSDRTLTQESELGGTIRLAQPGTKYPTGMPSVDAILNRNIHRQSHVS